MSSIAKYSAVSLNGVNPTTKLLADSTGYFKCILGGFNMENHNGVYYPLLPSVEALFAQGGIVRRRLDSGLCRGEYGHPKIEGMALEDALRRLAVVDPLLTSHHIKSIELVAEKDERKKDIILAIGQVRPTGPYGPTLQAQMENVEENVAFSIRSFTNNATIAGRPAKIVVDALTYDFVTEPGIKNATQFQTASLEELMPDLLFTDNELNSAIHTVEIAGLESEFSALTMVRTALGWQKVRVIKTSAIDWK